MLTKSELLNINAGGYIMIHLINKISFKIGQSIAKYLKK